MKEEEKVEQRRKLVRITRKYKKNGRKKGDKKNGERMN
jgi:hypothetical protein